MIDQKLKQHIRNLVVSGRKLEATRALRIATIETVDSQMASKLSEALMSDDLAGRVLLALPMPDVDPKVLAQTLRDAVADPQFESLSSHLKEPLPYAAWVRGFSTVWEEKLKAASLSPTAGQAAEVLMQLLSAMLEV